MTSQIAKPKIHCMHVYMYFEMHMHPLFVSRVNMEQITTFLIAWHWAGSENPIMFSGLQILRNGNSEFLAICAAKAVFPECGAPKSTTRNVTY